MSKIAQEAVARYCARSLDLPVVIARMNASYGPNGGLPTMHFDALLAGNPITTRWDPCTYSPIHQDDINEQTAALLDAASVPATIVNWAGDEGVSVQEWARYMGELSGRDAVVNVVEQPGTLRGSIASDAKRASFTGPCKVSWKDGLRRVWESRSSSVLASTSRAQTDLLTPKRKGSAR
jgi:nucleoside-diphosphate-sugar epimerase